MAVRSYWPPAVAIARSKFSASVAALLLLICLLVMAPVKSDVVKVLGLLLLFPDQIGPARETAFIL